MTTTRYVDPQIALDLIRTRDDEWTPRASTVARFVVGSNVEVTYASACKITGEHNAIAAALRSIEWAICDDCDSLERIDALSIYTEAGAQCGACSERLEAEARTARAHEASKASREPR